MDGIEKIIRENCWRFDKGYPDSQEDMDYLKTLIESTVQEQDKEEEELVDKLINIIRSSNLSDKELQAYIKSISNRGFDDDVKSKLLQKGYTADSFKVGDKAISYIVDKISDSEAKEFIDYTPKSFSSAPDRGNFSTVTGLSQGLVQDLINIEPGADAGGSAIGKGELFLALAFNDIDNRGGGGDLNFDGKNLEVKGDSDPWDTRPVDELSKLSSKECLAKNIASHLKKWIDSNDLIYDRLESEKEKKAINKLIEMYPNCIKSAKHRGTSFAIQLNV